MLNGRKDKLQRKIFQFSNPMKQMMFIVEPLPHVKAKVDLLPPSMFR